MVKINIDGTEYQVDSKSTIIEAARAQGIHIPHFCWHPKLSVSGNCRMCLVEVEQIPKLVISCATQVAEGMVVNTKSERVVKAQQAVMEFLLINHPLDCPICDEAGECKLQDYSYKYSVGYSRFEEDKVHKPKRVPLGPNVMLDVERCIMCSRCVRFSEEIANQPVLTFTQRGTHVVLTTFPGTELDNPYSMNVIELCPVGALTSRDFRFKSRVWEMASTESICNGCSRGCNMNIWTRDNKILRLTPRQNDAVNSSWMCDFGRLETFKHVNAEGRVNAPIARVDGTLIQLGWEEAISKVASELRAYRKNEIAGLGSAFATNEDNFVFQRLLKEVLGSKHIDLLSHVIEQLEDDLLIRADRTPNSIGARDVGVAPASGGFNAGAIRRAIMDGSIKALYVIEDDIAADPEWHSALQKLRFLIVHSSVHNATTALAHVVLPASTYAEKHGTMTNFQGRIQRIRPAVTTIETDRRLDGLSTSRWDKFSSKNDRWGRPVKVDARSSWRILASVASALGVRMKFNSSEEVMREIADTIPAYRGLTYEKIGSKGALAKTVAVPAKA